MPDLSGLQAWLGTLTDILGKVAIAFTAAIVIITLISPALAGRMLGWWHRRVAIRERFEAADATSPTTPPAAGNVQQPVTTTNADAIVAPPLPTPQSQAPAFPSLQTLQPPMPVRQWPPTAPATPPASAPVPKPAQATGTIPVARLRVPRYQRAWWLTLVIEILSFIGYVIAFATLGTSSASDLSGGYWFLGAVIFSFVASLMLAIWATSTAVRLRNLGWAWGIGISTLILLFFGPLAVLPTLLFTLIGPLPITGKLMTSYPRLAWVGIVVTIIALLAFVLFIVGVSIYGASETYDAVTGQYTIIDPASNATGNTLATIGIIVWLLGLLVGAGLNLWAFINSLVLRRWGWAITSLMVGYLPFAFNGPTTRPAPAQIGSAGSTGHQ